MKKKLILLLAAMAIMGTFVTGCSASDAKEEAEKVESEVKEEAEKVEGDVKEDAENVEEKVENFEHEFSAKTHSDLITIEATAQKAIEAGEKELEVIKTEAAAEIEKVKEVIEKDAGEAKDEALKLVKESEERLEALFAK